MIKRYLHQFKLLWKVEGDVLNIASKVINLLFNVLTVVLEFYGDGSTMNYILISSILCHNK